MYVCVCVCVCVRERVRERERWRQTQTQTQTHRERQRQRHRDRGRAWINAGQRIVWLSPESPDLLLRKQRKDRAMAGADHAYCRKVKGD